MIFKGQKCRKKKNSLKEICFEFIGNDPVLALIASFWPLRFVYQSLFKLQTL